MLPLGEDSSLLLGGAHLGRMRDSAPLLPDTEALQQRLEHDGYLLLRGLLPRGTVLEAQATLAAALAEAGWLADGSDPAELRIDRALEWDSPHPPGKIGEVDTQRLFAEPALVRCTEAPELYEVFSRLFARARRCPPDLPVPASTFNFKWLRCVNFSLL